MLGSQSDGLRNLKRQALRQEGVNFLRICACNNHPNHLCNLESQDICKVLDT